MKLLSDDARKAATAPIFAGSATRWSGVIAPDAFWPLLPERLLREFGRRRPRRQHVDPDAGAFQILRPRREPPAYSGDIDTAL